MKTNFHQVHRQLVVDATYKVPKFPIYIQSFWNDRPTEPIIV